MRVTGYDYCNYIQTFYPLLPVVSWKGYRLTTENLYLGEEEIKAQTLRQGNEFRKRMNDVVLPGLLQIARHVIASHPEVMALVIAGGETWLDNGNWSTIGSAQGVLRTILNRALFSEVKGVEGFEISFEIELEEGKDIRLYFNSGNSGIATQYLLLALFHLEKIRRVIELTLEYMQTVKEVK